MIYPILFTAWLSFHRWDMLSDERQFVGAANYVRVFLNASFPQVLSNSCVYMAPMTTLPVAPALLLVLWLNENSIVKNLSQSAIFTPHIVSMVSVGILWIWIMEPDIGLLNYILDLSGVRALFEHFGQRKIMWLEIEKGAVSIVAAALLGAVCMAGATETDTLECDLQVTKDGKVIIMRGIALGRTSCGGGFIRDHTYDELQRFDIDSFCATEFTGQRIIRFSELL